MKKQRRQRQQRQQAKALKRRQRTATARPARLAVDDSSAEAAWRRVPFGKGGPGGGIEGQFRYAMALMYGGQHGEADRLLTEIKRKAPLDARIPWLRGGNRLLAGELSGEAWAHVRQVRRLIHRFPQPVWDGSPMPERTLLVHDSNSGYGDTFQIARFVAAAKRQFQGTVMFGIMPGLPRLFTTLAGC